LLVGKSAMTNNLQSPFAADCEAGENRRATF
jgi:hypothetical protein